MKKLLVPFLFLIMPVIASGQNGNGSSGNPFYGTILSAVQWSVGNPVYGSTVYIGTSSNPDIIVGNGGSLTIDPGITIVFTQLESDLIITGSGILRAEGTSADHIVFTKDGSIAHWGHITFETPGSTTAITGTGSFSFCDVDYGYTTGAFPNPSSAGGAIQVNAPNVVIENCRFENNYARFGGAVTVNASQNTIIRNCIFKSNDAIECAGALLLHLYSSATVENCIFEDNYCAGSTQAFYGGGAIWIRQSTSKIVNCTFLNNSSPRAGDALYSYASPGSRIINSIFWGSNDQFATNGTGYSITNCAFETIRPASAVNSIILNSNNSASDGPNFIATDGSDWSIKFISPCRDAGVNSYSGVTIPSSDFDGNSTVFNKDIGAYEVQYSRWTGATSDSWSEPANWEGNIDPSTGTGDVIIPSGVSTYPVSPANPGFTINSGKHLILEPGSRATLNSLTNNGGILSMRANATELSSVIMSSYTRGTGAVEDIQIYLTGGYTNPPNNSEGRWHYISSPVDGLARTVFTSNTLDLARWVDGIQSPGSIRVGWVAYDGFAYLEDDPSAPPSSWFGYPYRFDNLELGKGYNFWDDLASNTYSISGQLNTQDKIVSMSFAGGDYENGFNLLGNPFTSGLDWDYILANTVYPENTSHGIIFTKNNIQYYYIGGVQVPDDGSPAGVIPPMQGFFVKTTNPAASINLTAAARTHTEIHPRYKGFAPVPLVRLELTENGLSDETVVRFAETAKSGFDYEFDALKMFIPSTAIYTTSPGMKYAINGQPYPDTSVEIPVSVIITTDGTHSITVKQLQGLDNYSVELKDNITGFSADLKTTSEVTFSASEGTIDDRFILKISSGATAIVNPKTSDKSFNIYSGFGKVNIQTVSESWDGKKGSVSIRDLTGRILEESANVEFSRSSILQLDAPVVKGMYIIEVKSGMKKYAGKVIIQ